MRTSTGFTAAPVQNNTPGRTHPGSPGGGRALLHAALLGVLLDGRAAAGFRLVAAGFALPAALLYRGAAGRILGAAVHSLGAAAELCRRGAARLVLGTTGQLLLAAIGRGRLLLNQVDAAEQQTERQEQTGEQIREHSMSLRSMV